MTPDESPSDAIRIARTLFRLTYLLDHDLRCADQLSIRELSVLRQIQRGNDHPSGLARELRLDPARVSRLTDRLVSMGYIERAPVPEDRRRWRLSLTEEGAARAESGRRVLANTIDGLLGGLGQPERDALLMGVEAIQREIDQRDRC